MNKSMLSILDILRGGSMPRVKIIQALKLTHAQYQVSSRLLQKKFLVSREIVNKKVVMSITDDGLAELERRKPPAKLVLTVATGHFINKMKLPIYAPSKELKFYRNNGNKHIKTRGF